MITTPVRERDFSQEFIITATRSSGPGGQNVNKVNTRVELRFNPADSILLDEDEKEIISNKLKSRITASGFIIIASQSERSQQRNKDECIEKFYALLEKALKPVKKRRPTSPTPTSKEKRLQVKKLTADKKSMRKKPE
jgi:ribosome-associated protein